MWWNIGRIKTKGIKLIENANNLIFSISLPSTKIKEIAFELNEEQKNDKDKINNLNELTLWVQLMHGSNIKIWKP